MRARAHHHDPRRADDGYDTEALYADSELWPGERAGPPLPRRRRRAARRAVVLLLVAVGAGAWALSGAPEHWPQRWSDWSSIAKTVSSWASFIAARPAEPTAVVMATTAKPPAVAATVIEPPAARAPAPSKPVEEAEPPPAPPVKVVAVPPPAASEEAPVQPLPPPASDPADPYRKRAEAVGLHPDLSRVLLDRLSPADYRNAAYAVETALARTADTAVFVWPRQRKPEQALFQVRFVQGAAPACRRYVVTITKDGWLTTALPMERCAAPAGRSARRE